MKILSVTCVVVGLVAISTACRGQGFLNGHSALAISSLSQSFPPMPPALPTLPVEPFLLTTNIHQFQSANQLFKHFKVVSHPSDVVVTQWMQIYTAQLVVTTNWVLVTSMKLVTAPSNVVPVLTPDGRVHLPDGTWATAENPTNHLASRTPDKLPVK